ncbi:MAG: NUDIX domain-containing protein [Nocardioidaceae bacterium]
MKVPCVGAVVRDEHGRILVILRGSAPAQGRWSIPGGRVEDGESLVAAVRREVLEETGLHIEVGAVAGTVELPGLDDNIYAVTDFFCTPTGAGRELRAGDDAADARWVTRAELAQLDTSPDLIDTLAGWQVWG